MRVSEVKGKARKIWSDRGGGKLICHGRCSRMKAPNVRNGVL
jgi:hypothetical protein